MPRIPVPDSADGGIFDGADGPEDSVRLADQVEKTIAENYGVALQAFLPIYIAGYEHWEGRYRYHFDDFIAKRASKGGGSKQRFAKKFASIYAACAVAAEMGVAPFTLEQARNALTKVFRLARKATRTPEDEADLIIRKLKKNRQSRFPLVKAREKFPEKAAERAWGFRRAVNGRRCLYIDPTKFGHLEDSRDPARDVLYERGLLVPEKTVRRGHKVNLLGYPSKSKKPRFILIDYRALKRY